MRFIGGLSPQPAISVITLMELMVGAKSRREEVRIARLEQLLRVLPVTTDIAKRAGVFIKHYQPSHGLDDLDAIIAATAEHHEFQLATLNIKHFPMFHRLKAAY